MPWVGTEAATCQIERRHRPAYSEFVHEFLSLRRPVVISGALDQWKALLWSPEYFRQRFPDHALAIDGNQYRMADFIQLVLESSAERPAPYLRNAIIDRFLPELLADIKPLPAYVFPNWLDGPLTQPLRSRLHGGSAELYIGGCGGKFPYLHFDAWYTHTFVCQIYGIKEFTIYSSDQTPKLYPSPGRPNHSLIPDIENPDYERFPLFAGAVPMRFRLEPGEILFIPCGTWHTTRMLTSSISVSLTTANASNWSSLTHDFCAGAMLPLKPAVAAYLVGMRLFRTLYGS
jgi:hypothetical protein